MNKVVDQRVVEIRFDNQQFESHAKTSMDTLNRLKSSLQMDGAAKGLESVNEAAKKVNFSPLNTGIETVKMGFSALQVMGVTTLANLTNGAVNAGRRMAAALMQPLIQGGRNRAQNIEQAKFQFEGLGMDVEAAMASALAAVKNTAYGLDEAARAASQFAASGMQAGDEMTSSLRAVAGVAAMTSSSYEDISRIFVGIAGNNKLMGEDLLQLSGRGINAAATLAKELGKSEADVRKMVSKGQIDFKTFYTAMDDAFGAHAKDANKTFSGSLANMKAAISRIGADVFTPYLQYARDIFNSMTPVIDNIHTELNPLITEIASVMKSVSEFTVSKLANVDVSWIGKATEAVHALGMAARSFVTPIKDAFSSVFSPITEKNVTAVAEALKRVGEWFTLNADQAEKVKSLFSGVFSIIKMGINLGDILLTGIGEIISKFSGLPDAIFSVLGGIGKFLTGVSEGVTNGKVFSEVIQGLINILKDAAGAVVDLGNAIKNKLRTEWLSAFNNSLKNVWNVVKTVGKAIGDLFSGVLDSKNFTSSITIAGLILLIRDAFIKLDTVLCNFKRYKSMFTDFGNFLKSIAGTGNDVAAGLGALKNSLFNLNRSVKYSNIVSLASAILMLAIGMLMISNIEPDKLSASLGAITLLMVELSAAVMIMEKGMPNKKKPLEVTSFVIGMAISIAILAKALKTVSDLDIASIGKGLLAIAVLMGIVVGAAIIMTKHSKKIKQSSVQLIAVAAAMKILASACKDFATMSWGDLSKGVAAITSLMGVFVGFQSLLRVIKPTSMIRSALAITIISGALLILADACKSFAEMSWEGLGKGTASIAVILGTFAGFEALIKVINPNQLIRSALAVTVIGVAMNIFAAACTKFAVIDWDGLAKAGASITVILGVVAGFAALTKEAIGIGKAAGALVIIGVAMEIFANVCSKLAIVDWEGLGKAGTAMVVILGLTAAFAALTEHSSGIVKSSAALLVMALALDALTPALIAISKISWEGLAKGLAVVVGMFTIFGVTAAIFKGLGLDIVLLRMAAAIAIFGAGCALAGFGVGLLASGLAALAVAATAVSSSIISAFMLVLSGLGEAIKLICSAISEAAPEIAVTVLALALATVDILTKSLPTIIDGLLESLVLCLDSLTKFVPEIVDKLVTLVVDVFDALTGKLPVLISAVGNFLGKLFDSIFNAVKGVNVDTILKAIACVGGIVLLMHALGSVVSLTPMAMAGVLAVSAVVAELGLVIAGFGALAKIPGVNDIVASGGDLLQGIGTAIGQFVGGIIGGVGQGIMSTLPDIGTYLSAFMLNLVPFLDVANTINPDAMKGVKTVADAILAIAAGSVIDAVANFVGGAAVTSFGAKIVPFGEAIAKFSTIVAGINGDAVTAAANAGLVLAQLVEVLPREGGWFDKVIGTKDLASFSDKIAAFGTAIVTFADTVININPDAVTAAANAGNVLIEMSKSLSRSGGWAQDIAGTKDLEDFGAKLVSFGRSVCDFAVTVSTLAPDILASETTAIQSIVDLVSSMSQKDFSGLAKFQTAISGISKDSVSTFLDAFSGSDGQAIDAGISMVSDLASGLSSGSTNLDTTMSAIVSEVLGIINGRLNEFDDAGRDIISNFASGIRASYPKAEAVTAAVVSGAITAAKRAYDNFVSAGEYLGGGLVLGIKDTRSDAYDAGYALGQEAVRGEKDGQQSASPSKATRKAGRWLGEGLILGAKDMLHGVYAIGHSMGKTATDAISNSMSKVSTLLNSDMDTQPVIRPIMDLTDVATGVGSINGMLNLTPSIGVMANIRAIDASVGRNQNGSNSDIIDAVNALGNKLSTGSGDVYNVNGITYDDGTNVSSAVRSLVRAIKLERRT